MLTITPSQVQGRHVPLRCRLGFHPWPESFSLPTLQAEYGFKPNGERFCWGHFEVRHRACPLCGAIQTKHEI